MNLETTKRLGSPRPARKRICRGKGSGLGKTGGKGHKGQGQHTSGGRFKLGFEGGTMPLFRRIPKRGFTNARFRNRFTIINVGQMDVFEDGTTVDFDAIKDRGLVSPEGFRLKVLGDGKLSKKLTVKAHRFSASARKKIEEAGGTITELGDAKPEKAKAEKAKD